MLFDSDVSINYLEVAWSKIYKPIPAPTVALDKSFYLVTKCDMIQTCKVCWVSEFGNTGQMRPESCVMMMTSCMLTTSCVYMWEMDHPVS